MIRPDLPTVAIIGRANVGKSTLFNRLSGTGKALVSPTAGTTRDRQEVACVWNAKLFRLIDTGGIDGSKDHDIERQTAQQSRVAMAQADLLVFVLDAKTGPLPQEIELARELLRNKRRSVIVVANKAENASQIAAVSSKEWRLPGLPEAMPISALRGTGTGDLLERIHETLTTLKRPPVDMVDVIPTRVAVIGKPNVGKSSLLNSILQEQRYIVSDVAHTTREPNDTEVVVDDRHYVLIDTAGVRKLGKVKKARGLEEAGVARTLKLLGHTDVTLFVLDASEPLGSQDRTLAGLLEESVSGVIVIVNKWDLIPDKTPSTINRYREYIEGQIPSLRWMPMLFVSAKTGQRVPDTFSVIDRVQTARHQEIPEEELDQFLRFLVARHKPSLGKGPKPPTIQSIRQIGTAPPAFAITIKGKRTDTLHPSYVRFIENRMHERFGFEGTSLRMRVFAAGAKLART